MASLSEPEETFWRLRAEIGHLHLLLGTLVARNGDAVIVSAEEMAGVRSKVLRVSQDSAGDTILWVTDGPAGPGSPG